MDDKTTVAVGVKDRVRGRALYSAKPQATQALSVITPAASHSQSSWRRS